MSIVSFFFVSLLGKKIDEIADRFAEEDIKNQRRASNADLLHNKDPPDGLAMAFGVESGMKAGRADTVRELSNNYCDVFLRLTVVPLSHFMQAGR